MLSTKEVEIRLRVRQSEDAVLSFNILGIRNEVGAPEFFTTDSQPFTDQAYARIQGAMNSAIQMALNDLQRQRTAEKLKQHNDMKGQDK